MHESCVYIILCAYVYAFMSVYCVAMYSSMHKCTKDGFHWSSHICTHLNVYTHSRPFNDYLQIILQKSQFLVVYFGKHKFKQLYIALWIVCTHFSEFLKGSY